MLLSLNEKGIHFYCAKVKKIFISYQKINYI